MRGQPRRLQRCGGARECWQSPEAGHLAPGTGGSDLGRFEPRPRPEALTAPKRHAVRGPASATRFPGHSDARLAPAARWPRRAPDLTHPPVGVRTSKPAETFDEILSEANGR